MRDPTRRNKNIGTKKQGHGQNNELVIPYPALHFKFFYERLDKYQKIEKTINGHDFLFIIEETREHSVHACTIDDLTEIISHIPPEDYGKLKWIILRQPKRKEERLSPAWGRLIYTYEFEKEYGPAVIIEAINLEKKLKYSKKLSPDAQKEVDRIREDGHALQEGKRFFTAPLELLNARNTQLYRTLPHEFGHYVHYLEVVERPRKKEEPYEAWEKRFDGYFSLPSSEKEKFAHNYADALKKRLLNEGIIPFDRKE